MLEEFFTGELEALGVILRRNGSVRRSFCATMHGTWEQAGAELQGSLTENFVFDDSETLTRCWTLTRQTHNRYTGTAADVEGTAVLQTHGNALKMDYALVLPVRGKSITVMVEDWLWLMQPDILVNKSILRKWNIRLGEIITTIRKIPS